MPEHMFMFRHEQVFDARGLGEVQALRSLDCDSFGAELTVMMMFAGMHLSSMHAAPEEDG